MNTKPDPRPEARPFVPAVYRGANQASPPSDLAQLRTEMRNELRALRSAITKKPTGELAIEVAALRQLVESALPEPPARNKVAAAVTRMGIEGSSASRLVRGIRARKAEPLEDAVRAAISEMLRVSPWPLASRERAIVVLVGPSGVGKTTTAAKIASHAILDGRSVTLVGCDNHRVDGSRQLQRWAELMGAEFETARDPQEIERILAAATTDVVVVDTAGTLTAADDGIERWIGNADFPSRRRHVLMCVPACLRAADANRLAASYAQTAPTGIAITKLDETDVPAGVVHAATATNLPIAILCNGPRVPEDIAPATSNAVLDALTVRRPA